MEAEDPKRIEMMRMQKELEAAKKEIEMLKMRKELEAAKAEIAKMKAVAASPKSPKAAEPEQVDPFSLPYMKLKVGHEMLWVMSLNVSSSEMADLEQDATQRGRSPKPVWTQRVPFMTRGLSGGTEVSFSCGNAPIHDWGRNIHPERSATRQISSTNVGLRLS